MSHGSWYSVHTRFWPVPGTCTDKTHRSLASCCIAQKSLTLRTTPSGLPRVRARGVRVPGIRRRVRCLVLCTGTLSAFSAFYFRLFAPTERERDRALCTYQVRLRRVHSTKAQGRPITAQEHWREPTAPVSVSTGLQSKSRCTKQNDPRPHAMLIRGPPASSRIPSTMYHKQSRSTAYSHTTSNFER